MLLEADNFLAFLSDNAIALVLGLSVLDEGLPPGSIKLKHLNFFLPFSSYFRIHEEMQ